MTKIEDRVEEGSEYDMQVRAKGTRGEGIGRIGDFVVFVNNAKTRIGNNYKVRVTKVHRTFAYAEVSKPTGNFIGNGSLLEL
ncbi:TRAM domain-containing protein [Candidatus Marsarchaeota archaeon]|nr:TRAM domain-containing protein [Candidatus Marsarchaeota archaeon]